LTYAWAAYISIILITFSIDYYVRITGNDFYYSGLNEYFWVIAIVFSVLISGYFIIYSMKYINKNSYKIIHLLANAASGFMFYAISSYLYIVGFGIDSI
ncbi:hypothetical protein MNBD_GAMMA10-386, partial [hydrothermal vent metagenome]